MTAATSTPSPAASSDGDPPDAVAITCVDYAPDQVEIHEVTDIDDFLAAHRPAWSRPLDQHRRPDTRRRHPRGRREVPAPSARHRGRAPPGRAPQGRGLPGLGRSAGTACSSSPVRSTIATGSSTATRSACSSGGRRCSRSRMSTVRTSRPIRQRIRVPGSRLRQNDVSFLLYVLLDGIVDRYFPLLERYSERLEDLEEELLERPTQRHAPADPRDQARADAHPPSGLAAAGADRPAPARPPRVPVRHVADVHARRLRPLRADHRPRRDLSRDRRAGSPRPTSRWSRTGPTRSSRS